MPLQLVTDVISLVMLSLGALFALSAAVGLVRFSTTLSRIHPITKPQTLGLVLTVGGAIIRVTGSPDFSVAEKGDLGILILLILFALITSPVSAQRVGRKARRDGLYGTLWRDDSVLPSSPLGHTLPQNPTEQPWH